jgi:hypothetical protein
MFYRMSAAMGGQALPQATGPAEGRGGAKQGQGTGHGREIGVVQGEAVHAWGGIAKGDAGEGNRADDPQKAIRSADQGVHCQDLHARAIKIAALPCRPAVTTPTLLVLKVLGSVIRPELVEMVPELRVMLWAEGMVVLKEPLASSLLRQMGRRKTHKLSS